MSKKESNPFPSKENKRPAPPPSPPPIKNSANIFVYLKAGDK